MLSYFMILASHCSSDKLRYFSLEKSQSGFKVLWTCGVISCNTVQSQQLNHEALLRTNTTLSGGDVHETLSHLTHLPHPALWSASQRLDGALEARLFDWRKYLQHARREKRRVSAAHTKTRVWRGQWEEIQGLFATDRYRMKGWKTLKKTRRRRRMWESDFIQHFGKSSIFTGITMWFLGTAPVGFIFSSTFSFFM